MKKLITTLMAGAMITAALSGCSSGKKDMGSSSSGMGSDLSSTVSSEVSKVESDVSSSSSEMGSDPSGPVELMIKDPQLKEAFDAVRKEFGEFYISMPTVITEAQMTEMYYVNKDDVEEFVGEMSMANVSGDTFVGAKCKPGKAEAVAQALEKRKTDIVDQFKTYPVNYMDLKSEAAQVITEGDYVFLVLMGDINVPDGKDASLQMAQDEVDRAAKAIRSVFGGDMSSK